MIEHAGSDDFSAADGWLERKRIRTKAGFVSGHRFSDAEKRHSLWKRLQALQWRISELMLSQTAYSFSVISARNNPV
jgi:hypothetical protein